MDQERISKTDERRLEEASAKETYETPKVESVRLTEEAAAMVAWLCSADCSFSTGAVFDLSGGRATY